MQHSATKARAKGALAGFVAASLAASLMIPSLAFAEPTSAEKQAEAQSALASLNAMQDRLDQASDNYGTALLEQQEAEHNRDAAQARIEEANAQIADLQGHLGARARSMYRTGNSTLLEQERAAQQAAEAAQAQAVVEASVQQATGGNGGGGGEPGGTSTPSNNGPTYNPVTGNAIVDRAYGCIGLPYVWGGVGPNGFDCSGLVSYAVTGSFSRLGTTGTFMGYPQVSDPQPGDIAVNSGHCGIYIGNNQMIHAPDFGQTVCIGPVQGGMIIVRP